MRIVEAAGATVNLSSLTVGNGLCAVPGRCNYNPCGQNKTTPRHVIPSVVKRSRGIFPSGRFYLVVVLFCHVVDSSTPVGMTQWGDVSTDSPVVSGMFQAAPLPSSVRAAPCQLPRRGSFCTGLWGAVFFGIGSVLSGAERHIGRSLRFRWLVYFSTKGFRTRGLAFSITETTGAKVERVSPKTVNCPLSTVNYPKLSILDHRQQKKLPRQQKIWAR